MAENTCVCCGAEIPEGRQVCPSCVARAYDPAEFFGAERRETALIGKQKYNLLAEQKANLEEQVRIQKEIIANQENIIRLQEEKMQIMSDHINDLNRMFDEMRAFIRQLAGESVIEQGGSVHVSEKDAC